MRSGTDLIYIRESHMVVCDACEFCWDEWDTGISLAEAVTRIVRDPSAVEELLKRSCPRCGHRMDWDVAIVPGSQQGTLSPSRQRRLGGTFRRLLREAAGPRRIAETVRRMYGVEAFYVRQEPRAEDAD